MALGVGYTVAGLGPLVMGLLVDLAVGYPPTIAVLLAAAAAQAFAIVRITRPVTADTLAACCHRNATLRHVCRPIGEVSFRRPSAERMRVTTAGGDGSPCLPESGGERIRRAAYELFSRNGVRDVGVDAVIARAGTAKMTLYRNFPSKDDLILDFLRRRERLWTEEWLQHESQLRGERPQDQLLAIFDLFSEWFERPDFEGCAFLATMMAVNDKGSPVFQASVAHLARIRGYLRELAEAAGVADPEQVARQWHVLMKGSIMAAHEGDAGAASAARELGVLLLRSHDVPVD